MPSLSLHSPFGDLTLHAEGRALVALDWGWGGQIDRSSVTDEKDAIDTEILETAKRQLDAYFDGDHRNFDLPLAPSGTPHQIRVWQALQTVPYGETRTYGDLAAAIDSGARPVGTACGKNPIPIIIPCHRILGANGALGGYSGDGGPETKAALLRLEGIDIEPTHQQRKLPL
ncbi:MAG: methylated-DNA--[protein]-cysteine S-methyltransferase [Pseudomonadota bacterium]